MVSLGLCLPALQRCLVSQALLYLIPGLKQKLQEEAWKDFLCLTPSVTVLLCFQNTGGTLWRPVWVCQQSISQSSVDKSMSLPLLCQQICLLKPYIWTANWILPHWRLICQNRLLIWNRLVQIIHLPYLDFTAWSWKKLHPSAEAIICVCVLREIISLFNAWNFARHCRIFPIKWEIWWT